MHNLQLPIILVGCLLCGCGSGAGDDTLTDNRTCITNINNNPIVNVEQAVAEAEELESLDVEEIAEDAEQVPLVDGPPAGFENVPVLSQVAICGTNTAVDAVISNPQGREALATFLIAGVRTE